MHPTVVSAQANTPTPSPPWWDTVGRRLTALQSMPKEWEPGAFEITDVAVVNVLGLLERLAWVETPEPSVVPMIDGGVQAEWHEKGVDLELRAAGDGHLSGYFFDGTDEQELLDLLDNMDTVSKWLARLSQSSGAGVHG